MVVSFKKPIAISVDRLNSGASDYISAARIDPDGTAIRIALTHNIKFNTIAAAERLYLDLLPESWSGVMPGLPQQVVEELANRALEAERQLRQQRLGVKPQQRPLIRVKVATQPTFTRYVFAMPEMANVVPERGDGNLTLEFDQPIRWDLADARAAMPKTLKANRVRCRIRFGHRHLLAHWRAECAHLPRGPQHRGRRQPRQRAAGRAENRGKAGRRRQTRNDRRAGDRTAADGAGQGSRGRAGTETRSRRAAD